MRVRGGESSGGQDAEVPASPEAKAKYETPNKRKDEQTSYSLSVEDSTVQWLRPQHFEIDTFELEFQHSHCMFRANLYKCYVDKTT